MSLLLLVSVLPRPSFACDLALALTVDVSASISPHEYSLQMNGLADALEHPEVAEALIHAQAALLLVQWSGQTRQSISIPWRRISHVDDLAVYANDVRNTPRAWALYSTAIGETLLFTAAQFGSVNDCTRKVIDVSGDGSSNEGTLPQDIRGALARTGITTNALAIESNVIGLSDYFANNVIGGPNAFVEKAENYEDYPRAIKQKLLRETVKPAS